MAKTKVKHDIVRDDSKGRIVIGITGKVGAGATFLAEHISKETGIKLLTLNYHALKVMNNFLLKHNLEKKMNTRIPKPKEGIQLFPLFLNMKRNFSHAEFSSFRTKLGRRVSRIIRKSKGPIIIDFGALPIIKKVAKKFTRIYLIESDDAKRFVKIGKSHGMTPEAAKRIDEFIKKYYVFGEKFIFFESICNDYDGIPAKINEIIERLKN